MPIDSRTEEEDGVFALEHCSATRKNGTLPFATTWVGLESLVLSGMSPRKMPCNFTRAELQTQNV